MTRPGDSTYAGSYRETADSDHGVATQQSPVGVDAQGPPAESMSRAEYAIYMRRAATADRGDDASGEDATGLPGQPDGDSSWSDPARHAQGMGREQYADHMRLGPAAGTSDHTVPGDDHSTGSDHHPAGDIRQPAGTTQEAREGDQAASAQGMTRSQYADYMQHGPAAGQDDPHPASTAVNSDTDREHGTTHPGSDADAGEEQGASQATADLATTGQSADPLAPQAAATDNSASAQDGRNAADSSAEIKAALQKSPEPGSRSRITAITQARSRLTTSWMLREPASPRPSKGWHHRPRPTRGTMPTPSPDSRRAPGCPLETPPGRCHPRRSNSRLWRPRMPRPGRRSPTWMQRTTSKPPASTASNTYWQAAPTGTHQTQSHRSGAQTSEGPHRRRKHRAPSAGTLVRKLTRKMQSVPAGGMPSPQRMLVPSGRSSALPIRLRSLRCTRRRTEWPAWL